MNKNRLSSVRIMLLALLATSLFAACTQNELADTSLGEMLPEGKYPVTFTTTGLETTADTRATADGTWTKGNEVAVQVEGVPGAKKYVAGNNGRSTTLNAASGVTPFYWQSTNDIYVSAWHLGTGYNGTLPETWSVQTDQSSSEGYKKSDFLYAPQTAIDFKGTKSLTFYHQTAKITINIRGYGVAAKGIKSVSIKAITKGTFTTPLTNYCGLSAETTENTTGITPFKLSVPNELVAFEGVTENALASYQALVIPQTGSNTTIEINIDGYAPFKYTPYFYVESNKWEGGTQYTYNLTIRGSEVTANVITDINWKEADSTGGGTVEI